jgi:hypothetical protein
MNYLESPNGQSPFEAARKPKACTQRIGPQQIGYPTAGRSAPESRPRTPDQEKGLFIYFLQKKNMQDKKNPHASERSETESKPKVCERVFPPAFVQEPKALETSHELSARGLFKRGCDSA